MGGLFATLLGFLGCGSKSDPASPAVPYKVVDVYSGLRNQIFGLDPSSLALSDSEADCEVYAVVMETGYPEGAVTLVAIADGTVSIYFSGGGGMIGYGAHEGPKRVCVEYISMASSFLENCESASIHPLPLVGETRFSVFTFADGVLAAATDENALGNNTHKLSPLFHKAHELIAEARMVDEQMRSQQSP